MSQNLIAIAEKKDLEREALHNADITARANKANDHNDRWLRVAQKAKRYVNDLPDDLDSRILVMVEHMVDVVQGMRDRKESQQ